MTDELYRLLNEPKWTRTRIDTKKIQITELHQMMLPGAVRYDKDFVQTSPEDPMLKFAEKLERLEKEKKELEDHYNQAYDTAAQLIEELQDARLEQLMTLRFLVDMKPKEVAQSMDYTVSRINALQGKAVERLEGVIKNNRKKYKKVVESTKK